MHLFANKHKYERAADGDEERETLFSPRSSSSDDGACPDAPAGAHEPLVLWALYIVCACTLLTAAALGLTLLTHPRPVTVALKSDLRKLEWRSSYIDFDVLYGPKAKGARPALQPFIQHAAVMAPVSRVRTREVYTPATRYAPLPHEGYAVMQARRLLVTPEMSTLAQFRTLDWGMDDCSVRLVLPRASSNATTLAALRSSTFELWLLDPAAELDVATLSFASKPRRIQKLGTMAAAPGADLTSASFECPRGAFPTVEVVCADNQCDVDVLHIGRTEGGLFLRQAQSVF